MAEILSLLKQDIRPAVRPTSEVGAQGERLAAEYLVTNGYRLVMRNFKVPVGRNRRGAAVTGEIDLIALDSGVLCFVEVKTKRSAEFADPAASVTLAKQRQIIRTARVYRRIFGLENLARRYDVISVVLAHENRPDIELTKAFWSENKFRKKVWNENIYTNIGYR